MKIYVSYLLKNLLKYFLLVIFTLTSIIWITRTIRYLYFITEYGVDFRTFLLIITTILPDLLLLSIPISSFLAVMFLYNKLIKNNELLILQNAGVSKIGFIFPVLFLSLFTMIISYFITLYLSPKSNMIFENQKKSISSDIVNVLLNNTNFSNFQNITFYAKSIDENILNSVFFYIREKDVDRAIYAKSGEINNTYITLRNGNLQEFTNDNDITLKTVYFDEYSVNLADFYKIDYSNKKDTDLMFLSELLLLKEKDNEVKMEIFNRIFTPVLALTLSILSCLMVLNIQFSRFENNKYIFIIYTVCLLNFILYLYMLKLGKKNTMYLYLTFISLFSPFFYIIYNFIKNNNVLCLSTFLRKK